MNDFIIQTMSNKTLDDEFPFMVKQQSTGWFYPNLSKIMAEELCMKLNEGQERFYIEDEYVKDKHKKMKSVYVEKYDDAIKLKDFLNENVKGDCRCCKKY